MKNILHLIIILTLISCGFDNKEPKDSTKYEIKNKDLTATKNVDAKIIGEWGIYTHIINGMGTNCNVCPRIEFTASESAILTLPSGDSESYKWSSSGNILKLELIDETSDYYLPNSEYKMEFNEKEKYIELTLSLSETRQFILRK
ncbi:MAG: hypothetical protein COA58_15815 [Bacteroidetes bacterium]|nr:MAG: hypothetical protein COA58_15815 [Bacteroidota bacterium]